MSWSVGVNLLWMIPGVVGGSEEYLCGSLVGLAELQVSRRAELDGLDVEVFALPSLEAAHPEIARAFPVTVGPIDGRSRARRIVAESSWLRREVRHRRCDVVHHAGGTMPLLGGPPTVVTIHDLQYRSFPGFFSTAKLAYLRASVPRSARKATVLAVPSTFVKRTIVDAFDVDPDRIVVVPPAIGVGDGPAEPPVSEAEIRSRYGLTGPFVMFPAITYPHKNHVVLVRAIALLRRTHPEVQLVLLGGTGPNEAVVRAEVERCGLGDVVVRTGRVPSADRDGLYRSAAALAFPSRYEGFGLPVVEAMALGCPVVAADDTALTEVVADAGRLASPDDPEQWAQVLAEVLSSPDERDRLQVAGRARAVEFSPEASALALVAAYRLARSS